MIRHLATKAKEINYLNDVNKYLLSVDEREKEFSTAIGHNVSIPHGKSNAVEIPFIGVLRSKKPILWDKIGNNVNLVFLLGIPEKNKEKLHLRILAELSKKLLDENFRELLMKDDKKKILTELYELENSISNNWEE